MAGLNQRLVRLEKRVAPPSRRSHRARDRQSVLDRAAPWLAGWHLLSETMAPRQVAHVESAIAPACWSFVCRREGETLSPTFGVPFETIAADALIRQVNEMIVNARPGAYTVHYGPFSLPETVADAYLSRPYANAGENCEDCAYGVPAGWFATCPLCGGVVRCNAYYRKHGTFATVFTIPAELIAAYREDLAPIVEDALDAADVINQREQRVVPA